MRTQSISSLSEEQEWLVGPVDPSGWLTGTPVTGHRLRAGTEPAKPENGLDYQHVDGGKRPVRRSGRVGRSAELGAARVSRSRRPRRPTSPAMPELGFGARETVVTTSPTPATEVDRAADVEGYRMGRWTRLALTLTVLTATVVVIALLTAGSAPHTLVDVTVGPGDSLWSIAAASSPDSDPRAVIQEIREINGISTDVLPIGVVLRVPATGD